MPRQHAAGFDVGVGLGRSHWGVVMHAKSTTPLRFAGNLGRSYDITMQMHDPLSLSAGLPARLMLVCGLVALVWLAVWWAL